MAYNKHDIQDASSYLDGVPVKISEKFRPPRKVTLPVGFMTRLETTLESTLHDTSFDFSLARSVSENSGYRKAQKEIVREERRARIAQAEQAMRQQRDIELTEQLEKLNMKMEKAENDSKAKDSTPPLSPPAVNGPEVVHPQVAPQLSSAILTPMLLAAPKSSSESKTKSNSFNFKDFENDTSSPFDNVELKTINDLEELAHVLHSEAKTAPAPDPGPIYNFDSRNNNSYAESQYFYPNQAPAVTVAPGQFFYPQQQQTWPYQHPYNPAAGVKENHSFPAPVYSQANDVRYHFPQVPQEAAARTSKSVPDIMEELQKEAATSQTAAVQVPRVEACRADSFASQRPASFGSAGLENWKPWPDLDSPAETPSGESPPPINPIVTRAAPNPLDRLPLSAQKLARQISEMGFPVAKVVRACEIIGEDHKKVVDFLLQVQALEEKGFPDTKVEYVLGTLKLDEERAQQFLPVFVQLVDLGFSEDKVSAALIQTGCDRDKALDALLT